MPRINTNAVEYRRRSQQVLELRKAGLSFSQIAEHLGYADASGAKRLYDRALAEAPQQAAAELRALHNERLETLLKGVWVEAAAETTVASTGHLPSSTGKPR